MIDGINNNNKITIIIFVLRFGKLNLTSSAVGVLKLGWHYIF